MKTSIIISKDGQTERRPVTFSEFPDKDSHCLIADCDGIIGNHVLIEHELYPDQNQQIVKLLLLIDLVVELGAASVSAIVPYLPYARQDKRHIPGEAVSADTLCKLLHLFGVQTLYTFDCHFMKGEAQVIRSGLTIYNISLGPQLLRAFQNRFGITSFDLIGPDKGSSYFVKDYGNKSMRKERGDYTDIASGSSQRHVKSLAHDHIAITEKVVVIIDDMISTGGTILMAIQNLKDKGVSDVYCLAAHGLFLNGSKAKLEVCAKSVLVTDTIENPDSVPVVREVIDTNIIPAWLKAVAA